MKTISMLIIFTYALFITEPSKAELNMESSMILEQAAHSKMIDGDYDKAISLYKKVSKSTSFSRAHVAEALVELGKIYMFQGSAKALPTFKQVQSQYADQSQSFKIASTNLNTIIKSQPNSGSPASKTDKEYRLIEEQLPAFNPKLPRTYALSPDGSQFIFHAQATPERKKRFPKLFRELYIQDVDGGNRKPLIDDVDDWEWINMPRWSLDGRYLLYTKYKGKGKESQRDTLLLDFENQQSSRVMTNSRNEYVWLPDNKSFIAMNRKGFDIYQIDGSLIKHFDFNVSQWTHLGNVSPDAKQLVFHYGDPNKEDADEVNLWLLDLKSGQFTQMTDEDGFEGWPFWDKDGQYVYYTSGSNDVKNLYRRKVSADAVSEKMTFYSNASVTYPMFLPKSNRLFFTLLKDNHVIMSSTDANMGSPKTVVRGSKGMLAPDGSAVYYLDNEPNREGLWKAPLNGTEPTQLVSGKVIVPYVPTSLISPDGKLIAYAKHEGKSTNLYLMSSTGGESKLLFSIEGMKHLIPDWSPDSKEVVFAVDTQMIVLSILGGTPQVLATLKGWEQWSLEWSPDGTSIAAFAYYENVDTNVLVTVDRKTKKIKQFTPESEGQYKEGLTWHPEGKHISYMYYNEKNSNGSRIVSLDTGKITDLVNMPEPMWDYIGVWGPDNRYYFSSSVRGFGNAWGVYSFNQKTGKYKTLRHLSDRSTDIPSWSQDGKLMIWTEKKSVRQLWMMSGLE